MPCILIYLYFQVKRTVELMKQIIEKGDKAVVVSQWSKMLHVVMHHFRQHGIKCDILDGSVPVIKRNTIITNFNDQSHHMKVRTEQNFVIMSNWSNVTSFLKIYFRYCVYP